MGGISSGAQAVSVICSVETKGEGPLPWGYWVTSSATMNSYFASFFPLKRIVLSGIIWSKEEMKFSHSEEVNRENNREKSIGKEAKLMNASHCFRIGCILL